MDGHCCRQLLGASRGNVALVTISLSSSRSIVHRRWCIWQVLTFNYLQQSVAHHTHTDTHTHTHTPLTFKTTQFDKKVIRCWLHSNYIGYNTAVVTWQVHCFKQQAPLTLRGQRGCCINIKGEPLFFWVWFYDGHWETTAACQIWNG